VYNGYLKKLGGKTKMLKLNFNPFPTLKTDRLVLRQLDLKDDQVIFDYQSNKENFKYVDMPVYTKVEDAQNYIMKMNEGVENNRWIIWAIADANTNKILGTISIWNISNENLKGELGYGLYSGNTGKGIMNEALMKVVEYGFDHMGLKTIEAYTNSLNSKSISLLERNHFTKTSSIIETNTTDGEPMELDIFCRVKTTYE
jgi:[ribosomal protein S5]-alanine N-acetyltransferase